MAVTKVDRWTLEIRFSVEILQSSYSVDLVQGWALEREVEYLPNRLSMD